MTALPPTATFNTNLLLAGSSGAGQDPPAWRIACIARKPPSPRNTACPKSSMPPWPSSMLKLSAKTIAIPIRHSSDSPNPPGAT